MVVVVTITVIVAVVAIDTAVEITDQGAIVEITNPAIVSIEDSGKGMQSFLCL